MNDNESYAAAYRGFCAANINLVLVQTKQASTVAMAVSQAMGNVEGCAEFLVRQSGARETSEFFYRLADGIAAPMPVKQENENGENPRT